MGFEAVKAVIAERPQDYLRAVVSILPKEVDVTDDRRPAKHMSEDELNDSLAQLRQFIASRRSAETAAGDGTGIAPASGAGKPRLVR